MCFYCLAEEKHLIALMDVDALSMLNSSSWCGREDVGVGTFDTERLIQKDNFSYQRLAVFGFEVIVNMKENGQIDCEMMED